MDCQISSADDVAEVVLIGSLDSSWSQYLSDRLDEVIRTGVREVRLDMSGVSYLSSNGIALLVRYHRQMRQIGGCFRIVADSEAVGARAQADGRRQDAARRGAGRRRSGDRPGGLERDARPRGHDPAGLQEALGRGRRRASS